MACCIVIEGPDGAGKTTLIKDLTKLLKIKNRKVVTTHDFDSLAGCSVRTSLRDNTLTGPAAVAAIVELRAGLIATIAADVTDCVYVVDRGWLTTIAEQGILEHGDTGALLKQASDQYCNPFFPVGIAYVYTPCDIREQRLRDRGADPREASTDSVTKEAAYAAAYAMIRGIKHIDRVTVNGYGDDFDQMNKVYGMVDRLTTNSNAYLTSRVPPVLLVSQAQRMGCSARDTLRIASARLALMDCDTGKAGVDIIAYLSGLSNAVAPGTYSLGYQLGKHARQYLAGITSALYRIQPSTLLE